MTSNERVLTAVNHRQPDRVPLFYRCEPEVEARLLRDLNLPDAESLMRYLHVDFRFVWPEYAGPPLWDEKTGYKKSIWGVEYRYVPFSKAGGYWEAVGHPLAQCDDVAALDDYPWPDPDLFDFGKFRQEIEKYRDYATMTAATSDAPEVLGAIQRLCGEQKAWTDVLINPDFFEALLHRVLDFQLAFLDKMLTAAEGGLDFIRVGDDYGTQRGLLIGLEPWRRFLKPALRTMAQAVKSHGAYYYHHSCGAVRDLIPDLIEVGVNVLDPLQVNAAGMVPAELKAEFGRQISFCGGVDEQEILPHGTPEQVRQSVQSLMNVMAPGGGFILGPTHNLQVDIPTKNILAMYEAAQRWSY